MTAKIPLIKRNAFAFVYFEECCKKNSWKKYKDAYLEKYLEDNWKFAKRFLPLYLLTPLFVPVRLDRLSRDLDVSKVSQRGLLKQIG